MFVKRGFFRVLASCPIRDVLYQTFALSGAYNSNFVAFYRTYLNKNGQAFWCRANQIKGLKSEKVSFVYETPNWFNKQN